MTDVSQSLPVEIRSRFGGVVLFTGNPGESQRQALERAVKSDATLSGADLSGANLCSANLCSANLSDATLSDATLSGANLSGEKIISTASIAFTGHGECGRTLLGIKTEKSVHLRCGCFSGSTEDLIAYIAKGDPKYKHTRSLALTQVIILLEAENEVPS